MELSLTAIGSPDNPSGFMSMSYDAILEMEVLSEHCQCGLVESGLQTLNIPQCSNHSEQEVNHALEAKILKDNILCH